MVASPEEESNVVFLERTKTESISLAVGGTPMPMCGSKWHQPTVKRVLAAAELSQRGSPCALHLTSPRAVLTRQSSPIKNVTGGCCQKEQFSDCN